MLGCAQHGLYEDTAQRLKGRAELLLRASGGGAVLTGPWLVSASLALPPEHPWVRDGLMDSYRRLGQLHQAVLDALGATARTVAPQDLKASRAAPDAHAVGWACFGSLSPWELVDAAGRKLVGLAQRRQRSGVLLVAGTLVGQPDWALLCEAMGHPEAASVLQERTSCVEANIGQTITARQFASALSQELQSACFQNSECY